jgi:hypothetical protein
MIRVTQTQRVSCRLSKTGKKGGKEVAEQVERVLDALVEAASELEAAQVGYPLYAAPSHSGCVISGHRQSSS